jgi:hypothetical protein
MAKKKNTHTQKQEKKQVEREGEIRKGERPPSSSQNGSSFIMVIWQLGFFLMELCLVGHQVIDTTNKGS